MILLTKLERDALLEALAGDQQWKAQLRAQVDGLEVVSREQTGGGSYTYFRVAPGTPAVLEIPAEAYSIPPEVLASHPAIKGDVYFLAWLKDGFIDFLEIASGTALPIDENDFRFARKK